MKKIKKHINELRAGVYLSYINLLLGSIIPMFYTPVMLKLLGKSEYGLYSLANSAVSYLSLLSFGFGSTILRYLASPDDMNESDFCVETGKIIAQLEIYDQIWVARD